MIYDSNTRVLSLININWSKYKIKHYLEFLTNKWIKAKQLEQVRSSFLSV